MTSRILKYSLPSFLLLFIAAPANGQAILKVESPSFQGVLHDNVSNQQRQGSGFTPLVYKPYPAANLFRDDAVGLNFEHIFNGAKDQHAISMFTPRHDACHLKQFGENQFQIHWPSKDSTWGMESRMTYDVSQPGQVDLVFACTPTKALFSQGFVTLMWASYMNRALNRKIHFWGQEGSRTGWVEFGEGKGKEIEVGTVSQVGIPNLPFEPGAQTLNLIEHPHKKFITPFYYGLLDGDQDLKTKGDTLLYLVLFDQTSAIRFAMWNFFKNDADIPDTHSPAWDWQYVIRNPQVGQQYGYRARIVVKPFKGRTQIWREYQKWGQDLGVKLPSPPPH